MPVSTEKICIWTALAGAVGSRKFELFFGALGPISLRIISQPVPGFVLHNGRFLEAHSAFENVGVKTKLANRGAHAKCIIYFLTLYDPWKNTHVAVLDIQTVGRIFLRGCIEIHVKPGAFLPRKR